MTGAGITHYATGTHAGLEHSVCALGNNNEKKCVSATGNLRIGMNVMLPSVLIKTVYSQAQDRNKGRTKTNAFLWFNSRNKVEEEKLMIPAVESRIASNDCIGTAL